MGMTIEGLVTENDKLKRQLAYESTALTMMKADYNARLKADLVAMLTEIQLEIEELDYITFDGITKRKCLEIIDKYKAESEADNGNDD